jgi:two-component system response regulator HydG
LFLDEAGELPLSLQAKLLRAVEYGEVQRVGSVETRRVDVNVIAATNRDLRAEAAAGRFRTDLFYRLSTIEIALPPLRDRREDIPYLAARFVRECSARVSRPITGMAQSAERLLFNAPWPGNIRELRNVLERACILSEAGMITERDLSSALMTRSTVRVPDGDGAADDRLSTLQRRQVERVLEETGGNKSEAARRLGISRRALYRRIDEMNLAE